jgi:hypothetical protein
VPRKKPPRASRFHGGQRAQYALALSLLLDGAASRRMAQKSAQIETSSQNKANSPGTRGYAAASDIGMRRTTSCWHHCEASACHPQTLAERQVTAGARCRTTACETSVRSRRQTTPSRSDPDRGQGKTSQSTITGPRASWMKNGARLHESPKPDRLPRWIWSPTILSLCLQRTIHGKKDIF